MFGLAQKDSNVTNATIAGTLNVSHAAIEDANVGTLAATSITVAGQPVYPSVGVRTVFTLPQANNNIGRRMAVSDASVVAAGNFGAIVVGGGANFAPVYSDGNVWRIG